MNMKDQLSAFMDGEIALSDAQHLMTGVSVGGELKQAWQHYHLIGDAMRGDVHMHHDMTPWFRRGLRSRRGHTGISDTP